MNARVLHVLRPGLQTTVQDLGRWGYQAHGVPVAGPMDPFSHRLANALVGNDRSAAALEMTLAGPELEFESECLVAIGGAEFTVTVDNLPAPNGRAFIVPSHARMHFGGRIRGARAYLAVAGGLDVPFVLGSRATHAPSGTGGWQGRPLRKNDRLPIGVRTSPVTASLRRSEHVDDMLAESVALRILTGPDTDRFGADAVDALQSGRYVIGTESDRMGFRLHGPALRHAKSADIISDVTPAGTIQVPGSGQPILLMADCQTTGGYPRIATVISADLGMAGQRAPGDTVSFRVCTAAEALSALIARENALLALEASWS